MTLSGQCLKDFNKWSKGKGLLENWNSKQYSLDVAEAMYCGFIVLFFDSVGIIINIDPYLEFEESNNATIKKFIAYILKLNEMNRSYKTIIFKTRTEVIKAAILEANELHNEK